MIEAGEIKTLAEHEDFRGAVAAASDEGLVVAAGTGVRVGSRDAIEIAREEERFGGIGQLRSGGSPFHVSASLAFLHGPFGGEEALAELDELGDGEFVLFAILKMVRDGNFLADQILG